MESVVNCTIISSLYGDTHDRYLPEWLDGIAAMDPQPHEVILSTDRSRFIPQVNEVVHRMNGGWKHQESFHLTKALGLVTTDWVWIHNVDDVAYPDALDGIDEVEEDVWQLGFHRSDDEIYLPPQLTAAEVLASERNLFVGPSCIRTAALKRMGGVPDCALQDWTMWRKVAQAGGTFKSSDRVHFYYRRHRDTRGAVELTLDRRAEHTAEMEAILASV